MKELCTVGKTEHVIKTCLSRASRTGYHQRDLDLTGRVTEETCLAWNKKGPGRGYERAVERGSPRFDVFQVTTAPRSAGLAGNAASAESMRGRGKIDKLPEGNRNRRRGRGRKRDCRRS
jgi:hypothetical protein